MIDLTPLDVRNKRGDFKRLMRGYDPQEVDIFLELVAERLEGLVRENLQLKERTQTLQQQVTSQLGREQAVQDALVTAQELRADIKAQSQRESEHIIREAEAEARRLLNDAEAKVRNKLRGIERRVDGAGDILVELERRRTRFLKEYRAMLQREMDVVEVEESRTPLEERAIDLDLGPGDAPGGATSVAPTAPAPEAPPSDEPDPVEALPEAPVPAGDEPEVLVVAMDAEPDDGLPGAHAVAPQPAGEETVPYARPTEDHAALTERSIPTPLETPSFTSRLERRPVAEPIHHEPVEELSASMEAEAVAQAQSEVVEVTGADADRMSDVPRLEEVLAEAGAEMNNQQPEVVTHPGEPPEEIAPPRIRNTAEEALLLYPDESDA